MPLSDSMFLFEIMVETLVSYVECKEFYIRSQFADVFTLNLKDPNDLDPLIPTMNSQKKTKVRNVKNQNQKPPMGGQNQSCVSIFTTSIGALITAMKTFPIEVSLFSKNDPNCKLGSTCVPWSPVYIDYLYDNLLTKSSTPALVSSRFTVYDDTTSKRVATIKLKIKLSHLKGKLTESFRSLPEENRNSVIYTAPNSKIILNTIKEAPYNNSSIEKSGLIKTVYYGGKHKIKAANSFKPNKLNKETFVYKDIKQKRMPEVTQNENKEERSQFKTSITSLVQNDSKLDNRNIEVLQTNSCSEMSINHLNMLNNIYGDSNRVIGNQNYCVGYFTVENDLKKDTSSSKQSSKQDESSDKSDSKGNVELNMCEKVCQGKTSDNSCNDLELTTEDAGYTVEKCKQVECQSRPFREAPPQANDSIFLDLMNIKKDCCKVLPSETVVGGMKAEMKFDKHDCFCSCECKFGFVKSPSLCDICGGFKSDEEMLKKRLAETVPCPMVFKVDKKKALTDDSPKRRNCDEFLRSLKRSSGKTDAESEKKTKKGHKKKRSYKLRMKHGFTGIPPLIGHSDCGLETSGTPNDMGWLWNADAPGHKYRPMWRPGAIHKQVVRLLRIAKNPGIVSRRRKKETVIKKRPLKRPLLTVEKMDGEYTVTMEAMKIYPKQRARNQPPYEDKPPLTHTIGRTEEENIERLKKKLRARRRLERDQRNFIQSAFSDMCKDICLKTYQQALGILPDTESPDCPCYPKHPGADDTNLERSCSCSDDPDLSFGSDTDSDEWKLEFTPPIAFFDPAYKGKRIFKSDNSTQYTYLDYRVKLLDRSGNQVQRFFKGPDGKTQCSDLGGFWSQDHKWLEINNDGFIGPDGRWAPMTFVGPEGEHVECADGKFQLSGHDWLVVGVDGYVDSSGRWKFYGRKKAEINPSKKRHVLARKGDNREKKDYKGTPHKRSETTWSCFGDADPKDLSKLGILGHGNDRKVLLNAVNEMMARGEDVEIPKPTTVPRFAMGKPKSKFNGSRPYDSQTYFSERQRCKHAEPSNKGIVAVDEHGHKTYFKLRDYRNKGPKERLANLAHQGISLSSFHVPCFNSFISSEVMKKQQYERILNMYKEPSPSKQNVSTGKYKIYKYRDTDN